MSNLSEEEKIIEDIKEIINKCKECKFATCEQCEINWTQIKTVEHLLDLYNKEKEKNIKAGELLGKRINMCNQFQIELDKEKEKNKKLIEGQVETIEKIIQPELFKKYISKDKLREILQDKITYRQFELQQEYKDFKDDIKLNTLQDIKEELLEERN